MKRAALMVAAALAMAGAQANLHSAASKPVLPIAQAVNNTQRRAVRHGSLRHLTGGYPQGPGWTVAHVKRMARKTRNQARHKAHCKGGSRRGSRGCPR